MANQNNFNDCCSRVGHSAYQSKYKSSEKHFTMRRQPHANQQNRRYHVEQQVKYQPLL